MIDLECWNIAGDTAHQKISKLVRKKLNSFDRKNYDDEKEWDGVKEEDKKMEEEEEGLGYSIQKGDNIGVEEEMKTMKGKQKEKEEGLG